MAAVVPSGNDSENDAADDREPLVRLVRGAPTPEELAALVGVVVARSRPAALAATPSAGPSPWLRLSRPGAVGPSGIPARPGATAWRLSARPR